MTFEEKSSRSRWEQPEAGAMKDLQRRLVVLVSGLLLLAAVFVSYRAGERFETSLTPQRLGVALEIGHSVAVVVERALAFGVPFDQLVDTERFLEAVKLDHPGVDYIIITTLDGQPRYSTDLSRVGNVAGLRGSLAAWNGFERSARIGRYFNTAIAINGKGRQLGWLHLGERANIIEQLLRDIVFDILTVLVVAILVAFELMRLLLAASFATPMRAINEFFIRIASGDFRRTLVRDFFGGIGRLNGRLNTIVAELNARARRRQAAGAKMPPGFSFDLAGERSTVRPIAIENIRWSFFLLIFAESLSLSFFPIFVAQFYDPAFGLPLPVVIGIPITVFMLVWAITMPFAGTWCDRIGYRLAFSVGAAMTTIGLVLTAFSTSLADLLLWRSITAVGYGIVYVTTQAYITVFVSTKEGTQGQAMFELLYRLALRGCDRRDSGRPARILVDILVLCRLERRRGALRPALAWRRDWSDSREKGACAGGFQAPAAAQALRDRHVPVRRPGQGRACRISLLFRAALPQRPRLQPVDHRTRDDGLWARDHPDRPDGGAARRPGSDPPLAVRHAGRLRRGTRYDGAAARGGHEGGRDCRDRARGRPCHRRVAADDAHQRSLR
jgi:hypothetical protein